MDSTPMAETRSLIFCHSSADRDLLRSRLGLVWGRGVTGAGESPIRDLKFAGHPWLEPDCKTPSNVTWQAVDIQALAQTLSTAVEDVRRLFWCASINGSFMVSVSLLGFPPGDGAKWRRDVDEMLWHLSGVFPPSSVFVVERPCGADPARVDIELSSPLLLPPWTWTGHPTQLVESLKSREEWVESLFLHHGS
jgi:hypothetical protein